MTDDRRFERSVADTIVAGAPGRAPDELLDRILEATQGSRPRPRLVAMTSASTMRSAGSVAVGSPALRPVMVLVLVALLLAAFTGLLIAVGPSPVPERIPAERGTFSATGEMHEVREAATATRLADGRVLVVGGYPPSSRNTEIIDGSSEIWDPLTGTFSPSAALVRGRWGHAATLLADGRVLIVGGYSYLPPVGDTQEAESPLEAQVWDPATETFAPAGRLAEGLGPVGAWTGHDGRIWIVGMVYPGASPDPDSAGFHPGPWVARVWTPSTMTFANASLAAAAEQITASAMPGGRRLWVDGQLALVWDPATRGVGQLRTLPARATKTLLPDGRILVAGGTGGPDGGLVGRPSNICGHDAQLWDPMTATGVPTGPLRVPRAAQAAALLDDGRVLVVGNYWLCNEPASAEVFALR